MRDSGGVSDTARRLLSQPYVSAKEMGSVSYGAAAAETKCGITCRANSSWVLIAFQCSTPPGLTVIAISVSLVAQLLHRRNPLNDIRRRSDPNHIVGDHLVVGHVRELL